MALPPQIVTVSLAGTQNLQTQNLTVLASASTGTTVQLGIPPSGANPSITVVSPLNGATIDLIGGALGIVGTGVVSGTGVATIAATGVTKATFAGGYWLIS